MVQFHRVISPWYRSRILEIKHSLILEEKGNLIPPLNVRLFYEHREELILEATTWFHQKNYDLIPAKPGICLQKFLITMKHHLQNKKPQVLPLFLAFSHSIYFTQGTGGMHTSVCATITSAHSFTSKLGYVEALTKLLFSKMPDNSLNIKINVKCSITWDARIFASIYSMN